MQDLQTKSLWSQISGECISGPLEGKKLDLFHGTHTTFGDFKRMFHNGILLKKPGKGEEGSPYDSYFADRNKLGIFGRENNYYDLRGKDIVFGIRYNDKKVAISENYLKKNRFALITEFELPVIVTYSESNNTVSALIIDSPGMDHPENIIYEKDRLRLLSKKLIWDSRTGKTISTDGRDLDALPVITAYWFAWISFFPDTRLIK